MTIIIQVTHEADHYGILIVVNLISQMNGICYIEIWKWLLGNWFMTMRTWFENVHYLLLDITYDFHDLN